MSTDPLRPLEPPRQWDWTALAPIAAGLFALLIVEGWLGALFAGLPGVIWLATGLALLCLPGDRRVTSYMALGGVLGALFVLPVMFVTGFLDGLIFAALATGCFVAAGRASLFNEFASAGVPEPDRDLQNQVKVGFDEAIMGYFLIVARIPVGERARRMCDEALGLEAVLKQRGWLDKPEGMHGRPEAPKLIQAQTGRMYGFDFERLSFDSEFAPDPELPGAALWAGHQPNLRTNAWVLRHPGPPRPWLMCIHGYRMGDPWVDFGLFRPGLLHRKFGLNLIMPTLPLHGPRKIGRLSGDQYLDGDLLDLLFAQTQALWDLRRWVAWLRASEEAREIGLYGFSLGGYNTGLLSGYAADLDFGVAVIPVIDFAETLWRVMPPLHRLYFESQGLSLARYRELLRPVSPLARPTKLARDRRFVVAASADRIVPVAQPLLLANHWDVPVNWYQGSHMSVGREFEPRAALEQAMLNASWGRAGPGLAGAGEVEGA
ncbi:MAG: alpha/beta hydrolase family protein [Panacagrimonas sp.]